MLWQVAFPLSTPILAVVVLQTFTAAYGSYLWALVVCQDDSMWTLMVHMFQLQQWAPSYVTMAAAVLCSIPTLLIFVLAQNMIMRGVVIPVYK
jgi:multiple sugar transport system permease protein